jgi:hypothetical protein
MQESRHLADWGLSMAHNRDETVTRLMRNLQAIGRDIGELHEAARGWQREGRGQTLLRQVARDFRQLEARALALATEIGHMDAMRRQFTGATQGGSPHVHGRAVGDMRSPSQTAIPKKLVWQDASAEDTTPVPTAREDHEKRPEEPEAPPPPREKTRENEPVRPAPGPESPSGDTQEQEQQHEEQVPPPAPPDEKELDAREAEKKRVAALAQGLPKSVLEQLRKQGLV